MAMLVLRLSEGTAPSDRNVACIETGARWSCMAADVRVLALSRMCEGASALAKLPFFFGLGLNR